MEITLEQVERLREKAAVSYGQAKAALEYSGGNLLDALIYLEERGVIPGRRTPTTPPRGGAAAPPTQDLPLPVEPAAGKKRRRSRLRRLMRRLRSILLDNELEIWRRGAAHHCHPHAAADRHSDLFFWIALPLMLLGLFFGFRYQVTGPDLEDDALNGVMGSVADTAADVGRQVMDELRSQHEKSGGRKN